MPGTCISSAVLGQGSSLKKANKMSALLVVANKSKEKADSGCESDSDSNYACEAPDFDEELARACSRPSGKQNCGTGVYSGKTDAGSSRFDNAVILDSAGRPCKKRKTESLNPVNAATVNLTASKPCSATALPNSSHVPQVSKNNAVDSGPVDVCCDVHKADGEEAAHLEDNEKVTPSCSQDSIQPAVSSFCESGGRAVTAHQRSSKAHQRNKAGSLCESETQKASTNDERTAQVMAQVYSWPQGQQEIWLAGHSYVHHLQSFFTGALEAKARKLGVKLVFHGQVGLCLGQFRDLVNHALSTSKGPPAIWILHVGGNDLVRLGRRGVLEELLAEVAWLGRKCPNSLIVWSHMIPRFQWTGGRCVTKLNHAVKRINNKLDKLFQTPKLQSIGHGCIREEQFFLQDGVNLSTRGNQAFIEDILAWVEQKKGRKAQA